ncbi:hypothetical protein FACS189419_03340 [Planctomycetales bacterium]|nr:hypothetical protein FACS189419_03340 [Planctomycetales bacterium]
MNSALFGLIIAVVYLILQIFIAVQQSKENAKKKPPKEDVSVIVVPPKKKPGKKRPPKLDLEPVSFETDESPKRRVLTPQESGSRFEAAQVVAPAIKPAVKTTLESMTGIYEPAIIGNNTSLPSFSILPLLTMPNGIQQAVILSEVFGKPVALDPVRK